MVDVERDVISWCDVVDAGGRAGRGADAPSLLMYYFVDNVIDRYSYYDSYMYT